MTDYENRLKTALTHRDLLSALIDALMDAQMNEIGGPLYSGDGCNLGRVASLRSIEIADATAKLDKGYCGSCKHRSPDGYCQSDKFVEESSYGKDTSDMLIYDYSEGGGFWVGEKFWCIHYAPRS